MLFRSSSSFSFSRMLRKKSRADASGETPVSAPTPTPSSSTRSSMDSQRTLTTPSSAVSASKPVQAPRDYEAALGALSSSYGFSGSVPASIPVVPAASTRTPRRKEARTRSSPSQMDEQTAHLGNLLSQYGTSSGPAVGGFRR